MRKLIIILLLCLSTNSYAIDRIRPVTRFQYPTWATVGMVGCWYFNNSSGSYNGTAGEIQDSTNLGGTGNVAGNTQCGGGYINNGLYSNGVTGSYAAIVATDTGLQIKTGSWGCWFKPVTGCTISNVLFTMPYKNTGWTAPYLSYGIYYGTDSGNYLNLVSNVAGVYQGGVGLYRFTTTGVWHHIICTWDGLIRKLYFDGTVVIEDDISDGDIAYSTPAPQLTLFNASPNANNQAHQGSLDGVAVWNVVLSSVQVRQIYEWGMGE